MVRITSAVANHCQANAYLLQFPEAQRTPTPAMQIKIGYLQDPNVSLHSEPRSKTAAP